MDAEDVWRIRVARFTLGEGKVFWAGGIFATVSDSR